MKFHQKRIFCYYKVFLLIIGIALFGTPFIIRAEESLEEKRGVLEQQIQALEKQAVGLDGDLEKIRKQKRTLSNEVHLINTQIKQRALEIRRLDLAVQKTKQETEKKTVEIDILIKKIGREKTSLGASLLALYTYDQQNIVSMLLSNKNLSDFFHSLDAIHRTQNDLQGALATSKENRDLLETEREKLEQYRQEQQELRSLQEVERRLLANKHKEKDNLLTLTKGNESLFEKMLQLKKQDIARLKTQLFYLAKTGITPEDAVRFADLAAKRTGIRTAFLLALLEVETGKQFENGIISAGTNLGTGNWRRDLYDCYIKLGKRRTAEAQKEAYFEITQGLGLDPDAMPVSRQPNYGCGGAMGSAQFLPSTWLLFKNRVARLTGHQPPSPWNVEDAFTAAALFLADAGASAQTVNSEIRAAKTYISGQPNCAKAICRSYANRIVSLADDLDRIF